MSYPETLANNIQHTGRMYFVISRGTIKRMILTGISNKLVLDIKWNSEKRNDQYQRSQGRKNRETTDEENEKNSKMLFKPVYSGNYC